MSTTTAPTITSPTVPTAPTPSTTPSTTPAVPATPSTARRWAGVLQRWPTLLALGMSVATGGGGDPTGIVAGYGEALLILPLLYLVVARMERRRASWPVLAAGITAIVVLRLLDVVAPSVVLVGVALAALVWSALGHDDVADPGTLRLQAAGMVGFGALAVAGLAVDVEVGRYLVAAGWFLHGVWDFVHLRLDRVVARSYAEWCGVVDILVAVQLAFLV